MREISLHIMDIAQNSISAGAKNIYIEVYENINENILKITIIDDGKGIDSDILDNVTDPFVTSRKTRKVGLGLSLFEAACKRCDGGLSVKSKLGEGTEVTAILKYDHIDRAPIGRISDTIVSLILSGDIDIKYKHRVNDKIFEFDTKEIKKTVGDDIKEPEILRWIKEYIDEGIKNIDGGVWE